MNKAYHEILPQDYFDNLFEKVKNYVSKGECVLISVMYGLGNKTAFNFLSYQFNKSKMFDKVLTYDPHVNTVNLIRFVKNTDLSQKNLIIVRFFEEIKNKRFLLEKLDSLRRNNPNNLVILAITDYTGIINPMEYVAETKPFFTQRIYLGPFELEKTSAMIDTFEIFYGWKINANDIKTIYKMSGGIPRLIKYICKELIDEKADLSNLDNFLNISNLFELEYLSKNIIKLKSSDLQKLGLTDSNGKIISRLLNRYFKSYKSRIIKELYPTLTDSESRIFTFLIENEGQIMDPDKIADLIKMTDDNFSYWAIYKLISRLKPKVKNNFRIRNMKGKGYFLEKLTSNTEVI